VYAHRFPLCTDTQKGAGRASRGPRRRMWASPSARVAETFRAEGIRVQTGAFVAGMEVAPVHDGPVTIVLET